MGTNFDPINSLIKNLSQASSKISREENKSDEKIDSKNELFAFLRGLGGIKDKAKASEIGMTEAEVEAAAKAELNEVLDFSFGTSELGIKDKNGNGYFDEDEISIENLMSLMDDEVAEYDGEGNPVVDQNGNPVKTAMNKETVAKEAKVSEMTHAGVPYEIAKEFADTGVNTHKIAERMAYITNPENIVRHGAVDNAQYGDVSNIANFIDLAVSEGFLIA